MPSLAILELSEKTEAMPFNLKGGKKKKSTKSKKLSFQHEESDIAKYRQMMKGLSYLKVVTG